MSSTSWIQRRSSGKPGERRCQRPKARCGALWARLAAASTCCWFLLPFNWCRARAQTEQQLVELQGSLVQWQAVAAVSSDELEINGQRLQLTSHVSEQPVAALLEAARRQCLADAVALHAQGSGPSFLHGLEQRLRPWTTLSALDTQHNAGFVACIAPNALTRGTSLWQRLRAFAESEDLSQLGQPQYTLARREAGATSTLVLTLTASGPLNVKQLLGVQRPTLKQPQAAGPAGSELPAPAESSQVVHARLKTSGQTYRSYETPHEPEQALALYTTQLLAQGFQVRATSILAPSQSYANSSAFSRGRVLLIVVSSLRSDEHGRRSRLQSVELLGPKEI